jgi:hypothetical protein
MEMLFVDQWEEAVLGKCSLDGQVVTENGQKVLVVKFKTK